MLERKRAGKESVYIEVDTSFARRRNSERSSGRKGREKREKEEKTRGLYRELQIIRASSELRRRMAEERANFSWRFPTCTQPFNLTSPCRKCTCNIQESAKARRRVPSRSSFRAGILFGVPPPSFRIPVNTYIR